MDASRRRQARSFGTVAENYDRCRPSYAPEAVSWALGTKPLRVTDLGAGTGILSRVLCGLGHEVIAIEPDDHMRGRLAEVSPDIVALAGTAEEIPLPNSSMDAVVAGQAYHWFDLDRAHPEIARVLRPGEVLVTMRNDADLATPWTVEFVEIIDGPPAGQKLPADFGPLFTAIEDASFTHDMWLTPDDLIAMAMTRSPYLVGTPDEREAMVAAIRELLEAPELAGRDPSEPDATQVTACGAASRGMAHRPAVVSARGPRRRRAPQRRCRREASLPLPHPASSLQMCATSSAE